MTNETPVAELWVTTRGWEHPGWETAFYPEDMPEEWRLSYYANHFPAVLLSKQQCDDLDSRTVEAWLDELEEDFLFYLEADVAPELVSAFADRLGGVLGGKTGGTRVFTENTGISLPNSPDSRVLLSEDGEEVFCLFRPAEELTLAELRADIEGILAAGNNPRRCLLCWDSEAPRVEALESAKVIAELLGA